MVFVPDGRDVVMTRVARDGVSLWIPHCPESALKVSQYTRAGETQYSLMAAEWDRVGLRPDEEDEAKASPTSPKRDRQDNEESVGSEGLFEVSVHDVLREPEDDF